MGYEVRAITTDEVAAFRTALSIGFGGDSVADGEEGFRSVMPLDRTVAAFDDGELVATLGDFPLTLTVPGGTQLSMAGTTMVTVRATHRRRGILRQLMRMHLDNAVERKEPIAGLWASEPGIYGRFGFGLATEGHGITIDTRHVTLPDPDSAIRMAVVEGEKIHELVAPFWSAMAQGRAGFIDREPARWADIVKDPEFRRGGGSKARHVVAKRGGVVIGYFAYRQVGKWEAGVGTGHVQVLDHVAIDMDAHRALWHYAINIDLFPHVSRDNAPVDDPIVMEASDARAIRRTVQDILYVRVLDVEAALTARTYETDGELVFSVEDDMGYCPGTYRMVVTDGAASVTSATADPDVSLDVRELAAMYLGRSCVEGYRLTGRVSGSDEGLRRLDQLFRTAEAPWCTEEF